MCARALESCQGETIPVPIGVPFAAANATLPPVGPKKKRDSQFMDYQNYRYVGNL